MAKSHRAPTTTGEFEVVIVHVLVMGTNYGRALHPSASVGIAEQAAARAAVALSAPASLTCCCGTEDGVAAARLLRRGKSPNQVPKTPPLRSGSDRHASESLAIVAIVGEHLNGGYANSEGSQSSFSSLQFGGTLAACDLAVATRSHPDVIRPARGSTAHIWHADRQRWPIGILSQSQVVSSLRTFSPGVAR